MLDNTLYLAIRDANIEKAFAILHSPSRPLISDFSDHNHKPTNILSYSVRSPIILNTILDFYIQTINPAVIGQALLYAADQANLESTKILLDRCANDITSFYNGFILLNTVKKGHIEIIELLLTYPSMQSAATHDNNAPLIEAQSRANGSADDADRYQRIIFSFMQIPAVFQLAAQQRQSLSLGRLSQFSENSMMDLNTDERALISILEHHYRLDYDRYNWDHIKIDILSYLEKAYNKNPALNIFFQKLPLHYTPYLSSSQNQAYYGHSIHTAWRYLSNRNPWISDSAQHVEHFEDGSKAAIISDIDKKFIIYIWIALNDRAVHLEHSFTIDGNKNIFAECLASIARSHNRDERPVHPKDHQAWLNKVPNIPLTTEDDKMPDRPSCSWGVKKSLLQSVYGHPYMNCPEAQALSPVIMRERMEERLVVPYVIEKLKYLPLNELKEIEDSLDPILCDPVQLTQKTIFFQIPQKPVDDFIQDAKLWFGERRINEIQRSPLNLNERQHDSYVALIKYCSENPLESFSMYIMNTFLKKRMANHTLDSTPENRPSKKRKIR